MNIYVLKARLYPVVIALLPIVVVGLYFSIQYQTIYQVISGIGLTTVFTFLLGQIGRDRGVIKEKKLWEHWGGTPSVKILRHSDDSIDPVSKKKLHLELFRQSGHGKEDTEALEKDNPEEANHIYSFWSTFLRTSTRDSKLFPLVFSENVNYGFRRNLWGLKLPAVVIAIIAMIIIVTFELAQNKVLQEFSLNCWLSIIGLLIILLFWIFYVRRRWVKIPAFAYAKRLIESTFKLSSTG